MLNLGVVRGGLLGGLHRRRRGEGVERDEGEEGGDRAHGVTSEVGPPPGQSFGVVTLDRGASFLDRKGRDGRRRGIRAGVPVQCAAPPSDASPRPKRP